MLDNVRCSFRVSHNRTCMKSSLRLRRSRPRWMCLIYIFSVMITDSFFQAVEQWKDLIAANQSKGIDVDLYVWLSRLTLDALGQGAQRFQSYYIGIIIISNHIV